MTYHDRTVAEILKQQAAEMGRAVTLIDASTIGVAGEKVTTVAYECAPLESRGRLMVERRTTCYVQPQAGASGNRTTHTTLITSIRWTTPS